MVLFLQKATLSHHFSPILKNNHHGRRSSEVNSASLQVFFHNLFFKLDNHHQHPHPRDALLASLKEFRTDVSNYFIQLSSDGSNYMSLIWIQQILAILPMISKGFEKLLVEINYPMSKWEASTVDEYLNYTLNLLQLLNLISSSVSHLSQARVSLSHAVSLIQESPCLAVLEKFHKFKSDISNIKSTAPQIEPIKESEFHCSGEERIIRLALADMQKIGSWTCGVVLSSLSCDAKSCAEIRKWGNGFIDSSFIAANTKEVEKEGPLKEVREIKEAVDYLVLGMGNEGGDDEAKELIVIRLELLEKGLMDLKKEGDSLFYEVLATRNELLDRFRSKNN